MAVDTADFHLDLFMRNLGDVGVALDTLPLAMHAAQEAVFQHHRETRLARRRGWREAFQAVTAEALFAGDLGPALIVRALCALTSGAHRPAIMMNETRPAPIHIARRAMRAPTPI